MSLINALTDKFGKDIINGLSLNLGAGNDSVEKSVQGTLPALMGGLINKVKTKQGAGELFNLLNKKEYDGKLLNNVNNLFNGSASINLLKNGLDILPMILGGQSKMGTILSIAGGLFGGGLSRSQSVFGMLAPVLLNFIGQKVRKDKLSQQGLVDLLNGQKEFVQKNTHKDIAKEMGFSKWGDSQSFEEEQTDEPANEETFYDAYKSSAPPRRFTKWLIPFGIIFGAIAALFLLTKACGEIPEEKQKAMDAKKAQQEEKRTQQQSQKGKTNQPLTNTKPKQPNRNVPAKPNANNTQPVKTNPGKPNQQNQTKNNVTTNRPNNTNQANANTTQNNTATKPTTGGRKGVQNQPQTQTPKTPQKTQQQQPAKQQTQPAANNVVQKSNNPATNTTATNPATQSNVKQNTSTPPVTRPGVKQNTPASGTKASTSKYRGSASIVDKAARSGQTQVVNFGTVTTDGQTLTRSAESNFKKIAQILKENPSTKISIRAHNQDYENPTQNANAKKTGTVRANLLKQVLVNEGVQVNRINVESLGNTEFLISKDPGNARNQRVSVKVN